MSQQPGIITVSDFRRVIRLICLLLILVTAPAIRAQQPDALTLSYAPFQPFLFDDENGEPRGVIRDIWELWSRQTGVPVVFQKGPISADGKVAVKRAGHVMAVLGPHAGEPGSSAFSLPLPDLKFFLYVRADRLPFPGGLDELSGKQVGVVAGGPASRVLRSRSPDVGIVPFNSHESLIRAAMSGQVPAFVMEKPVASTYLAKFKGTEMIRAREKVLFHHPLEAAVISGPSDLLKRIQTGFSALPREDIQKIISSWTGETRAVSLPAHTRTLRIAASIDNMPFHFADNQGRAVGMFVDLWKLWAEKTGVDVEFIPVPWASSLDMVKTGAADIHAGCFFSVHRDTYLDYANKLRDCQTHFFFHESIYGLKGLQDLKGFEIGVLDKDYAVEFVRRELPGAALKLYKSHQAMFQGVADGEIKVFVCDTPTALYFMTREDLISEFRYHPSRPLYRKPFFAAVREGNRDLVSLINQGLAAITPEERAVIERRWMGKVPEETRNQVIIGMDQSFPPFSMRSASGEPSGLLVAFWKAWARKNGREAVIHLYERQEAVNALKDGIIDILSSFPPRKTTHGWVGFSAPHYRLDWHLYLTRNRTDNDTFVFDPDTGFERMTVGALNHSRAREWLDNKINGPRTVGFDTTEQMILAAAREKIDGFLATPQEMAVLPGQMGLPGSFSKSRMPIFQMTAKAGVRNYNPGLVAAIEEGF
ncbi:MAG: transporter substrate-binding domain-containing protein, partial [Desulfobacterales bacterium]|nr:transporter substrate-binding domain-containing protein [Desulfobacterales bacterium]